MTGYEGDRIPKVVFILSMEINVTAADFTLCFTKCLHLSVQVDALVD